MRATREFTATARDTTGLFPKSFRLKSPAPSQPKRQLDVAERRAIFTAVNLRGSQPELLAAAFKCSLGTILRIVNCAVSEIGDVPATRPTTDGDAR